MQMTDELPKTTIPCEQILGQTDHDLARNGPLCTRDEAHPKR